MDKHYTLTAPCVKCSKDINLRSDFYRIDRVGGTKYYSHINCDDPKGDGKPPEEERFAYG